MILVGNYTKYVIYYNHAIFIEHMHDVEKSDSKARIVGRLSTIFQQLIQLGESREQLTQFRYHSTN